MVISAEKVPASSPEPLAPSVSFVPPSWRRVSFESSLHNFDFPVLKAWGRHHVLRCLNINRKDETITRNRRSDRIGASANFPEQIGLDGNHVSINDDAGSEEIKAKHLVQHPDAGVLTSKIYDPEAVHNPEALQAPLPGTPPASISAPIPASKSPSKVNRPCNLRTRRAPICKTPCTNGSPRPHTLEKSVQTRTVRLRSDNLEKRRYWPKISIHLSHKEIEEDIYALTGSRPCGRPRKRPRVIQQQLDQLLPGLYLPSISPVTYRVPQ